MADNQQNQQTSFTIAEAARLYGKDRSTVFKHTKADNSLSSRKEKRGERDSVTVIDLAELIRFYGEPPKPSVDGKDGASEGGAQSMDVRLELALMQERLRAAQERHEQLEKERDREAAQLAAERDRALEQSDHWRSQMDEWRKQAEAQTLLLTDERQAREEAEAQNKKRRWRLFG